MYPVVQYFPAELGKLCALYQKLYYWLQVLDIITSFKAFSTVRFMVKVVSNFAKLTAWSKILHAGCLPQSWLLFGLVFVFNFSQNPPLRNRSENIQFCWFAKRAFWQSLLQRELQSRNLKFDQWLQERRNGPQEAWVSLEQKHRSSSKVFTCLTKTLWFRKLKMVCLARHIPFLMAPNIYMCIYHIKKANSYASCKQTHW